MCLHISGQFEIVSARMDSITADFKSQAKPSTRDSIKYSEAENDQLYVKLKNFVDFHDETIKICELMSKTFAPIVILHFISSAIVICVCCLMLFLAHGPEKAIYVTFMLGGLTDSLSFTLGGTLLTETSTSVQEAAYNFEWYRCDLKCQKLILLAMIRAKRPTAVEVPFFKASLETFLAVRSFILDIFDFNFFCRSFKLLGRM